MSKKRGMQSSSVVFGKATPHAALKNELVHVFVDDQNLFWGIVNHDRGKEFRVDFGKLLLAAARRADGTPRGVGSAYIAGVIPDEDSFWEIAKAQGFVVHRGFLGANNRSKQDDAYLVTEITSTLYEKEGPSTIVLVAGDADYAPPLQRAIEKGWRTEIAFGISGRSASLDSVAHELRTLNPSSFQHFSF